jgi:hypothetical protein
MVDRDGENDGYENEGSKTVEIGSKTFSRLKAYSETTERNLKSIINEAVNNEITRCEVKQILIQKCDSDDLPKSSRGLVLPHAPKLSSWRR